MRSGAACGHESSFGKTEPSQIELGSFVGIERSQIELGSFVGIGRSRIELGSFVGIGTSSILILFGCTLVVPIRRDRVSLIDISQSFTTRLHKSGFFNALIGTTRF